MTYKIAPAIAGHGPAHSTQSDPPRLVRLWSDRVRGEQLARLKGLELQAGDDYGDRAWELADEAQRNLPEWARVDLPSPHVLGRVLGLFRTGACLKTGKLLRLELSAKDIADLLGYSKSTVEAALRILGVGPIIHHGEQIGRGLGLIHRGRRTAWGYLFGHMRRVYRTSRMVLTILGRMLLGLGDLDEHRAEKRRQAQERRQAEATKKAEAEAELDRRRRELEHIEGHGADGGGGQAELGLMTPEVGRHWLKEIQERL